MEEQYLRVPQPILYWPRNSGRKASSWVGPHLSKISQARENATKIDVLDWDTCHTICTHIRTYCIFWNIVSGQIKTPIITLHDCKCKEFEETERKRGHRYRGSKRALRGRPVPHVDLLGMTRRHLSQSRKLRRKKREETLQHSKIRNHHTTSWENQNAARRKNAESTTKSPMADVPNLTSETGPRDPNTTNRDPPNRLQRRNQRKSNSRSNSSNSEAQSR
jgi:hypothetical protein